MIVADFLPQFYQGRVCKYATGIPRLFYRDTSLTKPGL
ncbi:hypothetical protein AVEN_243992-1, partial [Araneus ventricosus]